MIYILGMSHAISTIDAFAGPGSPFTLENWITDGGPTFQPVPGADPGAPFDQIHANLLGPRFGPPLLPQDGKAPTANGPFVVNGRYVRMLRGVDPDKVLVTSINGNEHSVLSMVQHPVPYDFVLPWKTELGVIPGRQILPYTVVQQQVRDSIDLAVQTFRAIRIALPRTRVVQVMPPPPIPSEAHILRSHEPIVRNLKSIYRITPLSIRLKYHALYIHELIDQLRGMRIEWLLPPPAAVAPDGSLLEPFWREATHANTAYGTLVMEQIYHMLKLRN